MTESIQLCTQMILPKNLVDSAYFDFGVGGLSTAGKKIFWKPGQVITLGFIGGSTKARNAVRTYGGEWLKYANIEFLWLEDGYDTMIRIAFDPGGSWSYVGIDSLLIPSDKPTMSFGWLEDALSRDDQAESRRVIMHEFGHMLGMQHEQNHPETKIPWDKEAMYQHHTEVNGWSKDQVDQTYFTTLPPHPPQSEYDKDSIMHYPVENRFTIGDFEVGYNYGPSEGDKEFMRLAYPPFPPH